MATSDYRRNNMKDLSAEFFLPPQFNKALRQETGKLLALCVGFILVLATAVVLTQGAVVTL